MDLDKTIAELGLTDLSLTELRTRLLASQGNSEAGIAADMEMFQLLHRAIQIKENGPLVPARAREALDRADAQIGILERIQAEKVLTYVLFNDVAGEQGPMGVRYDTVLFDKNGVVRSEWAEAYAAAEARIEAGQHSRLDGHVDIEAIARIMVKETPGFAAAIVAQYEQEKPLDGRCDIIENGWRDWRATLDVDIRANDITRD